MSLGINATTSEGIVLAADSRQSYRNQRQMARIGSDSAQKVFKLGKSVGLIVTGIAFLPEEGTLKNVSRFIEEFKSNNNIDKLSLEEISKRLGDFFQAKYQYEDEIKLLSKQVKAALEQAGNEIIKFKEEKEAIAIQYKDSKGNINDQVIQPVPLQFLLAGFDEDKSHKVYRIGIPGKIELKRDSNQRGKEYGAGWIGQTDVVTRIVLGFDPRMLGIPLMNKLSKEEKETVLREQLRNLEYGIQWGTMTLQDGIDFSVLAIETTTAIQRFSDGIIGNPGDMPGVGGPIDVAVITKDQGFVWIAKKNLSVNSKKVDLDKISTINKI